MAATSQTMKNPPATPAKPAEKQEPSEAELHAAFKLRGERILDGLQTQVSNAEKLARTKKAAPSTKQKDAYHASLRVFRDRLDALINEKPIQSAGGIPDA